MNQEEMKQAAARAAIAYVQEGEIVGVGTGSTANCFIAELGKLRDRIAGAVSSSKASAERLAAVGVPVLDLNEVVETGRRIPVYVDGADEITAGLAMIKGGGGALTREKIVAAAAERFVCIADRSKLVERLGKFPLPVEVIPMARAQVARALTAMGGTPRLREGFVTDNGNLILDVHGLEIIDPPALESALNQLVGVVTNGLFALRGADVALLAGPQGVDTLGQ
jgi:ribose 5-phosphate isomerase A